MGTMCESIFKSAMRSFCRIFFAVFGFFIALFGFSLVYSAFSGNALVEQKTTMTLLPDAEGNKNVAAMMSPAILQLNIHGIIGDPRQIDLKMVENILLDSRTGLLKNGRVKGILLHINTPGGTVTDSDQIYQMLIRYREKYKTPIFAYVESLCASGGMYVASAADQIFSSPTAVIGSVGVVFGPFLNYIDGLEKLGIHAKTLTEGLDKDMMNPFRPWKEGEDASIKAIISYFYQRFVHIVTQARPRLGREKLINTYGAQMFDAVKAQELGYIDHAMYTRDETLLALLKEAKIDVAKPYQVVNLEPKVSVVAQMFKAKSGGLFSGKIEHSVDLGQPHLQDPFAYLYTFGNQ